VPGSWWRGSHASRRALRLALALTYRPTSTRGTSSHVTSRDSSTRIGALTQDLRARAIAIEVLGTIGDPAGLRWLVPLVDSSNLSEDETSWLASSLGDIGTSEARVLLDRLAARTSREHAGVHREIQIARDAIARRGSLR